MASKLALSRHAVGWVISAAAMSFMVPTVGHAAIVVDQSYLHPENQFSPGVPIFGNLEAAQTFTVGTSGILYRVDLQVNSETTSAPMTFRLREVSGIAPTASNSNALASVIFSAPVWQISPGACATIGCYRIASIDLSAFNIIVSAGQRLALSVEAESGIFGGWASNGNTYSGGDGFTRQGSSSGWGFSGQDFRFATLVDIGEPPGAVPEPTAWALTILGLAMIGLRLRTRQSSSAPYAG